MVKGVTRQVVVVRAPKQALFEQAIFLVRSDADKGVTQQELVQQAQKEAGRWLRTDARTAALSARLGWLLAGSGLTGLAWTLSVLL